MKKIKEVVVVEGLHDVQKLQQCLDVECIVTHGTHLSKETLRYIKLINEKKGVIVFTDDDTPGRQIRSKIQDELKICKHAYLDKSKSKTHKKVGVEHASCQDILEALSHCATYCYDQETLTYSQYLSLDITANKRRDLCALLNLPMMNQKRLYKTLNQLGYDINKVKEILNENNR